MRFALALPTDRVELGGEFVSFDGVADMARAAEKASFDAVFVTDHPYPDDNWMLTAAGHHALDPFVALSFAAAATISLRVVTFLCILPYRSPFVIAKAAASLDALSGGRLTLGLGAGYVEAEFRALGVDFTERFRLFEEGIVAIQNAWSQDSLQLVGSHFVVEGHSMRPRPIQRPRPPLFLGGNTRGAVRRAVELGDGWAPAMIDNVPEMLQYARQYADRVERVPPLDVMYMPMDGLRYWGPGIRAEARRQQVAELEAAGVTWLAIGIPGTTRVEMIEAIAAFGEEVLIPCRSA